MKNQILVVDDEASIRELLTFYLQKFDYQVTSAADAEEARTQLAQGSVDLVVLDVVLPDADGLHVLSEFRQKYPAMPVIMLTGIGCDDEILQAAEARGAAAVVSKTLQLDQLLLEVRRALYQPPAK
jgi:DNA-binding NtrC family response regulator